MAAPSQMQLKNINNKRHSVTTTVFWTTIVQSQNSGFLVTTTKLKLQMGVWLEPSFLSES